jgi:hypothetical protein
VCDTAEAARLTARWASAAPCLSDGRILRRASSIVNLTGRWAEVTRMAELVRMNDPGLIAVIEGLLGGANIPYEVTDRNMSVIEGSINAIAIRILVRDDDEAEARELLADADLVEWLR